MEKQSKATSSEFSLQESVIKVCVLIENAMYRTLLEGVRLCERRIPYILWNTGTLLFHGEKNKNRKNRNYSGRSRMRINVPRVSLGLYQI